MDDFPIWCGEVGEGPLVACAIHAGHDVRPEIAPLLRLDERQRLYEEDPLTDRWTSIAPTRLVVCRSRFEVDLNRPRESCVYVKPADAWGLDVWKSSPPDDVINRSLQEYDDFYAHYRRLLEGLTGRHGRVVVFDLHSYNHRRQGPEGTAADPVENPEINLGTRSMDRIRWSGVVDRWLEAVRSADFLGRQLDVRENVKFFGGYMAQWTHQHFPDSVCVLAIEAKKFFMDEWTGGLNPDAFDALAAVFSSAAAAVHDRLLK
jgi:N-formylglutamate amidohydrolase